MQGRLGRGGYFLTSFLAGATYMVTIFALGFILGMTRPELFIAEEPPPFLIVLIYLIYTPFLIVTGVATVKRLHDLDRPGSHYWLKFIPIYNLYLSLVLLLKPGTEGDNYYGSSPKQPSSQGVLAA